MRTVEVPYPSALAGAMDGLKAASAKLGIAEPRLGFISGSEAGAVDDGIVYVNANLDEIDAIDEAVKQVYLSTIDDDIRDSRAMQGASERFRSAVVNNQAWPDKRAFSASGPLAKLHKNKTSNDPILRELKNKYLAISSWLKSQYKTLQ